MRIETLTIQNFKKYTDQTFTLDPHFNLLVGDNGSGKTTILDALAVAAGVWLIELPDSILLNSRRNISSSDVRLSLKEDGGQKQFLEQTPVKVCAKGTIGNWQGIWERRINRGQKRTTNTGAKEAITHIRQLYDRARNGESLLFPVTAYYKAGRGSLSSNERSITKEKAPNGLARRWAAFYDCFSGRIRFSDLAAWFKREALARGNRNGAWRPGFNVVAWAIRQCVPRLSEIWFDSDLDQMVFAIDNQSQPLSNLSLGQRTMVALVADIAIKMVTQNAYLIPSEDTDYADNNTCPPVLAQTPGLVLIDELDVHLHPAWQRRIASELKRTFPNIQFVCTTHSPQVIGELRPNEIMQLSGTDSFHPVQSFGLDTNRVLEEIMAAPPQNSEIARELADLDALIDDEDIVGAREKKMKLVQLLGCEDDPELLRAETRMSFLETPLAET
jgi:predicted ATP-binding protein involved in virulence